MAAVPDLDLALRSLDASWDRARWERLPDDGNRYEVIAGVLYMTTAPSFFHQWILRAIVRVLFAQIDDRGLGLTLWSPLGVFMPGCDPVQPDIVVVRTENYGIIRNRRIEGIPDLIVEILSPGNAATDLEIKRNAYARCGVPEYWIVRPAQQDVVIYAQPDTALGDYLESRHIAADADVVSPNLPLRSPVSSFFAGALDTTL